jgi:hypothetical protein
VGVAAGVLGAREADSATAVVLAEGAAAVSVAGGVRAHARAEAKTRATMVNLESRDLPVGGLVRYLVGFTASCRTGMYWLDLVRTGSRV